MGLARSALRRDRDIRGPRLAIHLSVATLEELILEQPDRPLSNRDYLCKLISFHHWSRLWSASVSSGV